MAIPEIWAANRTPCKENGFINLAARVDTISWRFIEVDFHAAVGADDRKPSVHIVREWAISERNRGYGIAPHANSRSSSAKLRNDKPSRFDRDGLPHVVSHPCKAHRRSEEVYETRHHIWSEIANYTRVLPEEPSSRFIDKATPGWPPGPTPQLFGLPPSGVGYYGTFSHRGFDLRRKIVYRNAFLPLARASFRPNIEGTTVKMTIAPTVFVMVLTAFILGLFVLIAVPFLFFILALAGGFDGGIWPAAFAPLLGVAVPGLVGGIFYLSYRFEANVAERQLTEILQGLISPQDGPLGTQGLP